MLEAPLDPPEEFLEWYIDKYRHEAEEHFLELFEFAGSYFEA